MGRVLKSYKELSFSFFLVTAVIHSFSWLEVGLGWNEFDLQ